jgi:hypothetical protein
MSNDVISQDPINPLHTDHLEQSFGPIHAEVLRHDDNLREVKLLDENDRLRTFAITFLSYAKNDAGIKQVDTELRHGGLLGKTFLAHGYAIQRNNLGAFALPLSAALQKEFHTSLTSMPAQVIEFCVSKDGRSFTPYGTIIEIGGLERGVKPGAVDVMAKWAERIAKNKSALL